MAPILSGTPLHTLSLSQSLLSQLEYLSRGGKKIGIVVKSYQLEVKHRDIYKSDACMVERGEKKFLIRYIVNTYLGPRSFRVLSITKIF